MFTNKHSFTNKYYINLQDKLYHACFKCHFCINLYKIIFVLLTIFSNQSNIFFSKRCKYAFAFFRLDESFYLLICLNKLFISSTGKLY